MTEITIDLLRHGDVAGGTTLFGKTDEPLSTLGWHQMHSTTHNKMIPWNKIISSPLQRCRAFSEELAQKNTLPLSISTSFQEIDFGLWDGQLLADLYAGNDATQLMQFMRDPTSITPPEGESYHEFELRVITAWKALLHSLHNEKVAHCLVVTHGGVIKTIMSHVLGFPSRNLFRFDVPYACMSRIAQYDDYPPRLVFHGGGL